MNGPDKNEMIEIRGENSENKFMSVMRNMIRQRQ